VTETERRLERKRLRGQEERRGEERRGGEERRSHRKIFRISFSSLNVLSEN
jgi:hypothetical protein